MKIAIVGRKKDTSRYEKYLSSISADYLTTLSLGELDSCDGVILPGGGDVTPAFYGEHNKGSRSIDTELDIIQLQAVEHCIRTRTPLLGICKGLQVINVAMGGTLIQDLPTGSLHKYQEQDQHHMTIIDPGSFLYELYGPSMIVNSAHHQGVGKLGSGLIPIQWCPYDNCVEAFVHESLPIIGLQWHPERLGTPLSDSGEASLRLNQPELSPEQDSLQPKEPEQHIDPESLRRDSARLRSYFVSLIEASASV